MAEREHDEDYGGQRSDRLWRVEQRQVDILGRLDRLQNRIDENIARREAHEWRTEQTLGTLNAQLAELLKRPVTAPLVEMTPLLKIGLTGLLGIIAALAFGRAMNIFG